MNKNIAVIFGGASSEHDVSLRSACFIIENIDTSIYNIFTIGITREGNWILYKGPVQNIYDGTWQEHSENTPAFIAPDKRAGGIVAFYSDHTEFINIDVIFPVLHGKNGEDGTIQGLFQLCGIPYVGCDTLSSAICMDKAVTHSLLSNANIEQTPYLWFYADRFLADAQRIKDKITARLTYPVFVKPSRAGSSVGISKVNCEQELDAAVMKASAEDTKILIEQGVIGKEVECAVMGGRNPSASTLGEIGSNAEFYDYDDKYNNGTSEQIIPANIDASISAEIQKTAAHAYKYLGCSGLARVDFFVTAANKIILNEINTLPGFTAISMYPKLWLNDGLTAKTLVQNLIDTAFNRYK